MLKCIEVQRLRPGMYIHELCGSWMDHPFWRTSFPLKNANQLQQLRNSSVTRVWIDTTRGLDIAEGETAEAAQARIDQQLQATPAPEQPQPRTGMDEELATAASLYTKAKPAIESMFRQARMGSAIDAKDALPLVEEISSSVLRNPGAFISLSRLKARDDYTYMHSVAVCALMIALARQLGLNEEETREAGLGGLVHDLGKSSIPIEILTKPGKLTDEEFAIIKQHTVTGHRLLLEGRGAGEVPLDICLHHHEKLDGTGYPHRLAGERISLFARMGAVCDVYDAITSDRPYKNGWDPAESLRKMAEWSRGHFDETVFQAFVKSLGIYPVGSFVRLKSGRLGVVTEQNAGTLLAPRVRAFHSVVTNAPIPPILIDLADPGCKDGIVSREHLADWPVGDINRYWAGDLAAMVRGSHS